MKDQRPSDIDDQVYTYAIPGHTIVTNDRSDPEGLQSVTAVHNDLSRRPPARPLREERWHSRCSSAKDPSFVRPADNKDSMNGPPTIIPTFIYSTHSSATTLHSPCRGPIVYGINTMFNIQIDRTMNETDAISDLDVQHVPTSTSFINSHLWYHS